MHNALVDFWFSERPPSIGLIQPVNLMRNSELNLAIVGNKPSRVNLTIGERRLLVAWLWLFYWIRFL